MNIGKSVDSGKTVSLPADLVTQTVAILGRRGSGKTNTATCLVEGLLDDRQQVVIIDPLDVWWGLKSNKSGKKAAYPIVLFGGGHADLPIDEQDGSAIADLIIDDHVSCIVSLSEFDSDSAERRFVTSLTERIYHRKRKAEHRTPMMIVLEECHLVAPQNTMKDQTKMLRSIKRLVRQGRAFGIGIMMIDQRPATVHKDILTQAELLIAHQTTGPQDRDAIQKWVDANATKDERSEFMKSLPRLITPNGDKPKSEAWIWSPSWLRVFERIFVRERQTFDSSSTPAAGEELIVPERFAKFDIELLRGKLQSAIDRAKENDPTHLRARITELEREIKNTKPVIDENAIARALIDRDRHWEQEVKRIVGLIDESKQRLTKIHELSRINGEFSVDVNEPEKMTTKSTSARSQTVRSPRHTTESKRQPAIASTSALPKGEAIVLTALLNYSGGLERRQLTVITGYKRSSRDAYIARLKEKGFCENNGGRIVATSAGAEALPDVDQLPRGDDLQEFWRSRLPAGEMAVLDVLIQHHPESISREVISEETDYKRSSRDAYIARLSAKELVMTEGRGMVRASDDLF